MIAAGAPVPAAIAAFVEQLSADCGAAAQPRHLRGRRWRVTVSNDRVSMWVEYEALSRGRLQWAEYIDPRGSRNVTLSRSPCDFRGTDASGNSATCPICGARRTLH